MRWDSQTQYLSSIKGESFTSYRETIQHLLQGKKVVICCYGSSSFQKPPPTIVSGTSSEEKREKKQTTKHKCAGRVERISSPGVGLPLYGCNVTFLHWGCHFHMRDGPLGADDLIVGIARKKERDRTDDTIPLLFHPHPSQL